MAAHEGSKMGIATFCVFILSLTAAMGTKCTDISGYWQNELGSWMKLYVDDGGQVTGTYRTAVESKPGAAAFSSNITGIYSNLKDGYLLAFSVRFNHGASVTTWVGQCSVCGDNETLHTTYILRQYVPDPKRQWTSTVVNQNTFWRLQGEVPNASAGVVKMNGLANRTSFAASETYAGLQLSGKWKSNSNEEIEIQETNGTLEGGLQLKGKWKSNGKEFDVYGISGKELEGNTTSSDGLGTKDGHTFSAVTLVATRDKTIRSWAGYTSDSLSNSLRALEMAWLEHELNSNCADPREIVRFGMTNFLRRSTDEPVLEKSETILEKIRKFFTSMF